PPSTSPRFPYTTLFRSIHAHPRTAQRLLDRVPVDVPIEDGDQLALGRLTLTAVFTPGHAPGHLAFHEPRRELLFAGDMASTLSSDRKSTRLNSSHLVSS